MKLCMFSPRDLDLERGWPGRIEELIRRERPEIADVVVHTEPR